jgi:hypothetical protein
MGVPGDGGIMISNDTSHLATQLDEHHAPETNGRMSICRRCGARTDGPAGRHHLPNERQVVRSSEWLVAQVRQTHIDRARELRDK